jgi:hypothetical protein
MVTVHISYGHIRTISIFYTAITIYGTVRSPSSESTRVDGGEALWQVLNECYNMLSDAHFYSSLQKPR